ncbi:MAG: hypothetical protein P8R54_12330 [Myxococcota bacterium]|nr:hypothetical protein [Myxococcota bacterium]
MRLLISLAFILTLACSGLDTPDAPPREIPGQAPTPALEQDGTSAPLPSVPLTSLPEWISSGACSMPQILDADAALQESDASGPLHNGLLLCEVAFSGTPPKGRRWDAFGGNPDPSIHINDLPSACAYDTHDVTLSWQGVTLATGDPIEVSAYDRDLRHDDDAGTDSTPLEDWPVRLKGSHFAMTCGALTEAAVQARLPGRIADARAALSVLQQAMQPEPLAENWGWPDDAERIARRHLEDVAGHISWTAAPARALLANEAGIQARWEDTVAASIEQTRAGLSSTADLGQGLSVTVSEISCGYSCTVTLTLHNQGALVTLTPGTDWGAWLITPHGRDVELMMQESLPGDALTLTNGQQTTLRLQQTSNEATDRSMIRIKALNRHHILAIPSP